MYCNYQIWTKLGQQPTNITAPSRRIQALFPGYKKGRSVNAHAYRIIQRIGVEGIRKECPNFDAWFTRLEQLNQT